MEGNEIRPLFLLSIQRSGSTLLQRMLAAHPQIATVSEPWVLLPFLYTMRRDGVYSEYGHRAAVSALEDFVSGLPHGWDSYRSELRSMAVRLYQQSAGGDATYFLDKTPRYSLALEELMATFPDAKFVVLWRNPLAVISSIIETWGSGDGVWNLEQHKIDVYDGLVRLVDGYRQHQERVHPVRYEHLIADPAGVLAGVFDHLELPPAPEAVAEFAAVDLQGRMGDHQGMEAYPGVSSEPLTKWQGTLANPFRKTWCRRYLRTIGRERLAVMGYDLDELLEALEQSKSTLSGTLGDAYKAGRSLTSSLFETPMLRRKLALLPNSHEIHRHS
jgi:hypothetical protein